MKPIHQKTAHHLPNIGFGLGLRTEHYQEILDSRPNVDWFEIISENYMIPGGKPLYYLDKIRADYPMVMHGVSLSIGSASPLDKDYLIALKQLSERIEPAWISDHLCWTGVHGMNLHDLLPLSYTEETIQHVVDRISQVQDFLGRPILIENVSSYVSFKSSEMTEWEFINQIAKRSGCLLLLDVNNIYVSSINHSFDAFEFMNAIDTSRVQQIHLAGHEDHGDYIIDTHDAPIVNGVWDLYSHAIRQFGPVSTMIERDDHIPPIAELIAELDHARKLSAIELAA
jgi:uncharacterized protein (UPF0276 family)